MKCTLSDIAEVTMGQSPKSEFYNTEGVGIPFLQGNRTFGRKYPVFDTYTTRITKMAKAGDVIMSVRAPVGELNITPVDICLGRGVCGIRMKNGNQDFLFYLLKYYMPHLLNKESGTVFGSVNKNDINGLEIEVPDNEDDEVKISRYLTMFDNKIELNVRINKNLIEQLKFLFIDKIINNPKIDFVTQIPLVDLCSVITKGTTPTTLGKAFTSTGINFLKVESISELHSFDKSKFAHIDLETHKLLKRSIIKNKDILFTIAGTLGRFALVNNSILPANTNQAIAIIRANPKKISPEYLFSCLIGNWHNDYYSKRIQQSVQANLSLTTIKSLPIPVLQEKDMEDYLAIVNPIINMLDHISSENEYLLTIRDTLLPKLMSGEIDISNIKL